MEIETGKTYMTKNGRFIQIDKQVMKDIYMGEFERDGREDYRLNEGGTSERYEKNGKHWNYLFPSQVFNDPNLDIIMEDSPAAREIASAMKRERKQKAYDATN